MSTRFSAGCGARERGRGTVKVASFLGGKSSM